MKPVSVLCALLLSPFAALAQSAPPASVPAPTGDAKMSSEPTFVISKWKAKLYGFAEFDTMFDSTQSFTEIPGSGVVSTGPSTVAAEPAWSSAASAPGSAGLVDFFSHAPPIRSGVQISASSAFDTSTL